MRGANGGVGASEGGCSSGLRAGQWGSGVAWGSGLGTRNAAQGGQWGRDRWRSGHWSRDRWWSGKWGRDRWRGGQWGHDRWHGGQWGRDRWSRAHGRLRRGVGPCRLTK